MSVIMVIDEVRLHRKEREKKKNRKKNLTKLATVAYHDNVIKTQRMIEKPFYFC